MQTMEFNIEADRADACLREGVRTHTLSVGDHDATAMINGTRVDLQRLALTIASAAGIKIAIDGRIDGNEIFGGLANDLRESRTQCQRLANQLRRVEDGTPIPKVRES